MREPDTTTGRWCSCSECERERAPEPEPGAPPDVTPDALVDVLCVEMADEHERKAGGRWRESEYLLPGEEVVPTDGRYL